MQTMVLFCLALLLVPVPAVASSIEALFERISPSVGALYAQEADGALKFLCSITIVGKTATQTELLTANHCVQKDVSYLVTFDGRMFHSARVAKLPGEQIDPQKFRRQYNQPQTDAALFVVDSLLVPSVVPLGDDAGLVPGRSIVTVGFPLGATKIRYQGSIAGRYERPGSDINGYLILQIFGSPGSSGSAVIEEATGTVVGILVSGRQGFGTPVIFATPVSYLKFLRSVPKSLGE